MAGMSSSTFGSRSKEAVAIAKDIDATNDIDDQEEGSGYSQSRQNGRIDLCEHNSLLLAISLISQASKGRHLKILRFLSGMRTIDDFRNDLR